MKQTKTPEQKKKPRHAPKKIIRNICYMFHYTWKYTPGYIFVTLIEGVGRALWHVLVSIVFVQYIGDILEQGRSFTELLWVVGLIGAYRVAFEAFNKWMLEVYRPKADLKLHRGMQSELYQKALTLDQSCYDDPEFYNDFIWAIRESDSRTVRMMVDLSIFINRVLATAVILIFLAAIDWIILVAVLASVVAIFFLRMAFNKMNLERDEKLNPIWRKKDYIKRLFYLAKHAKELRQGQIGEVLQNDYADAVQAEQDCIKSYLPKHYLLSFLWSLVENTLIDLFSTVYLIFRYATDPDLSFGDFMVGINATGQLHWQMNQIVEYFNRFHEHSIYVDKFRRFMDYKATVTGGSEVPEALQTVELKDVTFAYPFGDAKEKQILKHLSLTIHKGEKVAFVGYNGAGKTTLTKLLMRLYDPTEGQILYNGKNIQDYDLAAYREHIGAVFQDYQIFSATLGENVMGREITDADTETILQALESASFTEKLKTLPKGIHTPLTREFDPDGVELSGGESQKVAIARVFARPLDLMIMDEPSSALDPIAEYELNHSITEDAKEKTVIFISHRLSTTRMADRIYLFENGEIIEEGNHASLMAQNGKYAHMYQVQAEKYQDDRNRTVWES